LYSIGNPHSSIGNPQFTIANPQSPIDNQQSALANRHSAMMSVLPRLPLHRVAGAADAVDLDLNLGDAFELDVEALTKLVQNLAVLVESGDGAVEFRAGDRIPLAIRDAPRPPGGAFLS
jgi:hypothetical protein